MPYFPALFLILFIPLNFSAPSNFWERFWNINYDGHHPYTVMQDAVTLPIPTATPIPTSAPTTKLTPVSTTLSQPATSSIRDFMMNEINNFRVSKGLILISTDSYTCNFAATRAQEITSNFSHDGFNQRVSTKILPYSSYKLVVENLARSGNYKDVVNLWINSSGHNANLSADTSYGCVGYSGDFYAYEGWQP